MLFMFNTKCNISTHLHLVPDIRAEPITITYSACGWDFGPSSPGIILCNSFFKKGLMSGIGPGPDISSEAMHVAEGGLAPRSFHV